jgi:hypothetical protein
MYCFFFLVIIPPKLQDNNSLHSHLEVTGQVGDEGKSHADVRDLHLPSWVCAGDPGDSPSRIEGQLSIAKVIFHLKEIP